LLRAVSLTSAEFEDGRLPFLDQAIMHGLTQRLLLLLLLATFTNADDSFAQKDSNIKFIGKSMTVSARLAFNGNTLSMIFKKSRVQIEKQFVRRLTLADALLKQNLCLAARLSYF